ncbi:fibronectin type III domain-containing protein [Dinghuibacter silviterrae]|uniref:PA14 domain-containing protein n=1 Tax=Dinghuibacter silviterrae TaxID=1539049 RepID=A0A4R8DV76_9BACT|nr:fibronectin type III domain-containing protein [Dinghuibacter silviterrae]TDX01906.1 PA14 domain-containing protein [Dinghuibacter silviterrae]
MPKLYAALLVLICVCLKMEVSGQSVINPSDTIVNYTKSSTPTQPPNGTIGKWGRTPSLSWNTTEYKCYILNGSPFRVHFPKTYNPTANDGKKYPLFIFFHGLGEAGPVTDNETQLYHGGQFFQTSVDNGTFDGYVLCMQSTGFFSSGQYTAISSIIDYMIANNKVDISRIVINGLSAGGQACWGFFQAYAQYVAGVLPMSAMSLSFEAPSIVNQLKYTPYWYFQGGQDVAPAPATTAQVLPYFYAAGANFNYTLFTTQGHDTWDSAWLEPNFFTFVNACNIANPWPLFGRTTFCPGDSIKETLGMVPGATAYQWRLNGTVIPGATADSLVVTKAGTYDCRLERGTVWTPWSPVPVNIVVQATTQTPNIALVKPQTVALPGADGTNTVGLTLPVGDSAYAWYKVGSSSVIGTNQSITVSSPGDYYVIGTPKFSCHSLPSAVFEVINAGGPNAPTAASSLVANSLGFTRVGLSWATQPNPTNPPTAFEVYRGTKSGGPYTYLGQTTPSVLNWTDSVGLKAGTPYYYVIRAIDTTGAAPLSGETSVTTNSDKIPPSAPGNVTVTGTTNTTIYITWGAATDNVSVDHYNIYVNGQLSNVTSNTSFILNGLTKGNWYSIYVVAVDGSGNVGPRTPQVDAQAIYSGLAYNFYISGPALTSCAQLTSLTPTAQGISPNTLINLYTGTASVNFGYIWSGYITIPVSGSYKFATSSSDGSELWFNSLTPTGTPTVNNNKVQTTVTQVTSSSMNLTAGTYPICIAYFKQTGTASMTVQWSSFAVNGNSGFVAIPNKYFAGTPTSPGTVPNRPTNVKATASAYNQVNLSWTDNSNNETGFEVYRSTAVTGPFNIVTTLPAGSTSFTDNSVSSSTAYYYEVQAINGAGGSGFDSLSQGGLLYRFYQRTYGSPLPDFDTATATATGRLTNFSLTPAGASPKNISFKYTGILNVTSAGSYTFSTTSAAASKLYIGTYNAAGVVVNNDFQQNATTRSGTTTLAVGKYPLFVAYDDGTQTATLSVTWKVPGATTSVAIPDSAFANANWTATTPPLPGAPVTPTLTATALSSKKISLSWTDTSSAITGYTLNRSVGDSAHFQLLSIINSGSTTSYVDTGLFGHQTYYYQLLATGPGGSSALTAATGATTLDNPPVVAPIPNTTIRYGTTGTINVSATDADGDPLAFTGLNLPAFVKLTDNGNGTAVLTLSPAQTDSNTYVGIGVTVTDGHGGSTNGTFTLTVNNNYPPVITAVAAQTVNTGSTLSIPLTATSPSGDNMVFSVSGVPNNYTLNAGPNGSDTLVLNPTFGAKGSYTVTVTCTDNTGGVTTSTFPLTVNFVNPTRTAYLRIMAGDSVGTPWNNITGQVTTGILDNSGNPFPWTFNFNTSWWGGAALGPNTGNNSGVYPDAVLHDFWFFGDYGAPDTVYPTLSGLDTTKLYNITLYAGSVFNYVPDNGTTVYQSEGQTVQLYVQNNTQNTVSLTNLKPDSTGTITIKMSKLNASTPIGYVNALVVTQLFDDGTAPLSPYNLNAALNTSGSGVVLTWSDSAYNETGYEIWRATSTSGPWTQLLPNAPAKATTATDTTTAGFTTYYYKVRALNGHGWSNYTNVASVTTPDKVPTLNAVGNISLNWGTADTIQVTTTGSTGNTVTLAATGLPNFATFTDNGNGTGQLIITAPDSTSGTYTGNVITMTDIADSTRTSTFSITVKNPVVTSVYVHFSDGVNNGATPWNNVSIAPAPGYNQGGLLNDANQNSGMTLTYSNGFAGLLNAGEETGNNSGVFPDGVLRSCLYESAQKTDSILFSGLNPATKYNFVIYSGTDWGVAGSTSFSLLGQTKTINPAFNTQNLLQFSNLTPRANGTVSLGVTKASAAQYGYLNDVIIQGFDPTKLTILGPSNLHTTAITRTSVALAWTDNSWNSTGVEVWRATDASGGKYSKLATLAAGTTTYTDANLSSNTTYYYTVRVLLAAVPSTYSNPVSATTSGYAIYMQFNQPNLNIAGLPWNSMNQQPVTGTTWNSLYDDQGMPTSTNVVLTGLWAGTSNLGMQTGNNSGAVPDAVMQDCYVLFAGQSGGFTISGLNIYNRYDVTFFNSLNFQSDAGTAFVVNGQKVILNASLNTSSTVTAYGIQPDQTGTITINVAPITPSTEYGIIQAIILRAYSPDANTVPTPPVTTATVPNQLATITGVTSDATTTPTITETDTTIHAYPNPFKTTFTLHVPAVNNGDRALVEMYSVGGERVYSNAFKGLVAGSNYLTIQPEGALQTGIYIVKVNMNEGTAKTATIKVMKQ